MKTCTRFFTLALLILSSVTLFAQQSVYTGSHAPDKVDPRLNETKKAPTDQGQKMLPPTNDECTGAILITQNPVCSYTSGTVLGATQSIAGCSGTADDDVWFKFVATQTSAKIQVQSSANFDAVLEVFSGNCGSLTGLVCMDNTLIGGLEVTLVGNLVVGLTYYMRVYDYYGVAPTTPTFDICVTEVPHCIPSITGATAEIESCGADIDGGCDMPTPYFQSLVPGETITGDSWSNNNDRDTDWYKFHINVATPIQLTMIPEFPVELVLMSFDNCVSSPVLKAIGGNACDTTYLLDTLAPGDYMVFVANQTFNGYPCGTNNFYILKLMTTIIQNDPCAFAIPVQCGSTYSGFTNGATSESVPVCNGVNAGAPGVWYMLPGNSKVTNISLCSYNGYNTILQVYSGNCGALTCVDANDNFCGTQSEIEFFSTTGLNYYIFINGAGGATGSFKLAITCTCPPPADGEMLSHTAGTATLGWTQAGNPVSWDVEAGPPGFLQNFVPDYTGLSNPGIVDPLQPNQEFDFFVRSVCGLNDYSDWIGPFYMQSTCPDMYSQPMSEYVDAHESYASNTLPANNCQLADDFIVPDGECWDITAVKVMFIAPSIDSLNLAFYNNATNLPGTQIALYKHPTYTVVNRGGHLGQTAWEIKATLPAPLSLCGSSGGTTYWLSAQGIGSGVCQWEVQTVDITGNPTAFRNPSGGLSSCTSWTPMQSCLGSVPTDAAFRLFLTESEPPVLTCPPDTVIEIISGTGAVYTYAAIGNDNCIVDTTYRIGGLASGASHPIGITTNTWVAVDANGNSDTCSFTVTVNLVIGMDEAQLNSLNLWPNPTSGKLTISIPEIAVGAHLFVYRIDGVKMADFGKIEIPGNHDIDISSLAQGLYFLGVEGSGFRVYRKFVKN